MFLSIKFEHSSFFYNLFDDAMQKIYDIKFFSRILDKKIRPYLRRLYYKLCSPGIIWKSKINEKNYSSFRELEGNVNILDRKIICVFSHFDKDNIVDDYVLHYLAALNEIGCAIIFVSTCNNIENQYVEKLKILVTKIVTRINIGWDFGSFNIGYKIAKNYDHYNLLIFANDSVYGPLHPLQNIISMVKNNECDVGAATDSYECGYHLQSYFLVFSDKVLKSKIIDKFFENFVFSNNKTFVVHKYEIGLSRLLINNGFKLKALCDYLEVANKFFNDTFSLNTERENDAWIDFYNPTHIFWQTLIKDFKCPLIKRDLLLKNPSSIVNFFSWPEVVINTGYDINLIKDHLKKINTGIDSNL